MISDWVIFWMLIFKICEKNMIPNISVMIAWNSNMNFPHFIFVLVNGSL